MASADDFLTWLEGQDLKTPLAAAGGFVADRASRLNPHVSIGDILSMIDSYKRRTADTGRQIADDPVEFLRQATALQAGPSKEAQADPEALLASPGGNIGVSGIPVGGITVPKNPKPNTMLGAYPTSTPRRIQKVGEEEGGYSVNLLTGDVPTEGLMMGKYANTDPRNIVGEGGVKQADIKRFAAINKKALEDLDNYFGLWRDPATGKVYYDVAKRFEDVPTSPEPAEKYRQATKFGERTNQIAGFDVAKKDAFPVKDWNAFVNSPEFKDRLDQMFTEGDAYMNKQNTKQWWDAHGTLLEDVYGTHDMPAVAGFTAATAPNEKVLRNTAMMTEYMRRYIKGEPIIQPEWRMPEDGLLFQKGAMMPLESGRVANLTAASRHELDKLSADKVRNEGQALMGDPNAAPFDLYWGRVAEKPREGVFTASTEGVVEPGPQYATMYDVVKGHGQATQPAHSMANYTAKVWAGIRERIKATGELFGTKYRRVAGLGESKGYADHFRDLIDRKSQMLGITPQEMEDRLSRGDANLMGAMMSSPLFRELHDKVVAEMEQGDQK